MATKKPTNDQLNAYVDGELSPEDAAATARAIADDPATAELVAKFADLKAAMPDALPKCPPIDLQKAAKPASPVLAVSAFRAAAMVAFVIAGGVMAYLSLFQKQQAGSWQMLAMEQHAIWVASDTSRPSQLNKIDISSAGNSFRPPDLSASKLTLAKTDQRIVGADRLTHFGYTGTRGCRLSLFVVTSPSKHQQETAATTSENRSQWQSGDRSYLLLSSGMDRDRFLQLADTIRQYSIDQRRIDQQTRQQMAATRKSALPCTA